MKHFNDNKKKVAFTLSATFMVENFHDKMLNVCNHSQIIFCNNEEAEIFSKSSVKDNEKEHAQAIHRLLSPDNSRILVITCGKHPVHVSRWDYDNDHFDFTFSSYVTPVHTDEIVDTNGCGDGKNIA